MRFNTEGNTKNFDVVLNIENEEDFLKRNVTKTFIIWCSTFPKQRN